MIVDLLPLEEVAVIFVVAEEVISEIRLKGRG